MRGTSMQDKLYSAKKKVFSSNGFKFSVRICFYLADRPSPTVCPSCTANGDLHARWRIGAHHVASPPRSCIITWILHGAACCAGICVRIRSSAAVRKSPGEVLNDWTQNVIGDGPGTPEKNHDGRERTFNIYIIDVF